MKKTSVMVVDDDPGLREMLGAVLKDMVDKTIMAVSAEEGLRLLEKEAPDLILLDMRMPGMGGIGFLKEASRRGISVPVVVITAFAEVDDAVEAMKLGAADYLSKPINLNLLEDLMDRFVYPGKESRLHEFPPLPEGVNFASPLMEQVLSEVAAAAKCTAPVLFTGESLNIILN